MPTLIRLPRNEDVLEEFGPYPTTMSLGQGTTSTQRKLSNGLYGFEPGTQTTLLTLVQLATPRPVHFFDIGAHIGTHSLIVSSIYPDTSVHVTAFEPTPRPPRCAAPWPARTTYPSGSSAAPSPMKTAPRLCSSRRGRRRTR